MANQNPFLKMILKLDHPPAGPNWVRFVCDDPLKTARAISKWAFGRPPFTYQTGYASIKDRIELGIDRLTAISTVSKRGAPAGRESNKTLVEAFFDYDDARQYKSDNPITFDKGHYRVSRDILVPVAPLSIIREGGQFLPVFVCGWSSLPFSLFQRRLLMTVYEDAFLSLTDFQTSPAEVLFFPKIQGDKDYERQVEIWHRADYEQLAQSEVDEAIEIFLLARDIVLRDLRQRAQDWKATKEDPDDPPPPGGGGQGNLF
ncbi:hypothetical protein [Methyloferula stellata]|uniref:hypothetical protein n=1 Tax=Methyloferula stellata TaxID=876270 RepID=UPI00037208E1|nr:hypothetical protein [Methyloferula stellata]